MASVWKAVNARTQVDMYEKFRFCTMEGSLDLVMEAFEWLDLLVPSSRTRSLAELCCTCYRATMRDIKGGLNKALHSLGSRYRSIQSSSRACFRDVKKIPLDGMACTSVGSWS